MSISETLITTIVFGILIHKEITAPLNKKAAFFST